MQFTYQAAENMYLCLFEDDQLNHLFPLLHTRGAYQLRVGAYTSMQRLWKKLDRPPLVLHARAALADHISQQTNLPVNFIPEGGSVLFLNGRIVTAPSSFYTLLKGLNASEKKGRLFIQGDDIIAAWLPSVSSDLMQRDAMTRDVFGDLEEEQVDQVVLIRHLWHILDYLPAVLDEDLEELVRPIESQDRSSSSLHSSAILINARDIYLAPSVEVHPGAILNASGGPIYLDEGAQIRESAIVKGPAYIGKNSVVKAQTNIEQSAVGPICKVAGEIHNVIFQSYSNKAHAGYAGNSYIGSWCNLGADTNTSNLRNDYRKVNLYNESMGIYESTGRQFLGLIMGDHSKCGINSMFNTGTVVGVSCNLYGHGYHPRYVPSFSWGSPKDGIKPYRIDKALEAAERAMARRNVELSVAERALLQHLFTRAHGKATVD